MVSKDHCDYITIRSLCAACINISYRTEFYFFTLCHLCNRRAVSFFIFFFEHSWRNCFKIFSYRKYARLRVTVRELIELCKYFLSNRRMAGMFRFSCERGARSTCKLCFFFFRSLMINAKLNFLID